MTELIDRSLGFLETVVHNTIQAVDIQFCGNMGNNETSVRNNFDALYGEGKFEAVKPFGEFHVDNHNIVYDDPSYVYVLRVPAADFIREVL